MTSDHGSGWPAYAAFWCALLFAVVTLYWLLGGTLAIETIGGEIERAVRTREPTMLLLLAASTVVKLVGALFALALVRPWGALLPRRLLLICGWVGTVVLVLYGGVLVGAAALVELGIYPTPPTVDRVALRGHLYVWDMWFLVWGILLGLAMRSFSRRG